MSISWQLDASPAPQILVLPPDAASLDEAHAAIELWERYSRKTLDPTQRLAVEVMMAVDRDGLWAAATTGREMSRQNGKGDEIEVVELWGVVQRGEAILHTVHEAALLATQAQQRLLGVLEGHGDLRRRIKLVWRGTGQQMIELRNGGVIWYRTRSSGGGRGLDAVDRLVVDEAQHATHEHVAAVSPPLLVSPNPQVNALGSGGIAGKSRWWWTQRRRALAGDPGRFGYVGHTAEVVELVDGKVVQHPVDVSDRELWRAVNPALGQGRGGGMDFLEEQFRRLGPEAFAREHLGVWDPDPEDEAGRESVFEPGEWQRVCSTKVGRPSGRVLFVLDVNQDRNRAALAVAGAQGVCGIVDVRPGIRWAVAKAAALCHEHDARVAVIARSPAAAEIDELERDGADVLVVSRDEYETACGWFVRAVAERRVTVRADDRLDAAVAAATKRTAGTDRFVWDRRDDATGDVCALVAVTVAAWAAENAELDDGGTSVW